MSYFFAIVMDHPDKPGDDIKVDEMIEPWSGKLLFSQGCFL